MSQQMPKRKETPDAPEGPAAPKRKVRSCDACRRLKTRCEIQLGDGACHRCEVLKIECSLGSSVQSLPAKPSELAPQNGDQDCHGCKERCGFCITRPKMILIVY